MSDQRQSSSSGSPQFSSQASSQLTSQPLPEPSLQATSQSSHQSSAQLPFQSSSDPAHQIPSYLYTFACHENELSLCQLELRSLFGGECALYGNYLISPLNIDPSRSPFIKLQIALMYDGGSVQEISEKAKDLQLNGATFKVVFVETAVGSVVFNENMAKSNLDSGIRSSDESAKWGNPEASEISFDEQRGIEREIGWNIHGKADMRKPERLFGIARLGREGEEERYRVEGNRWVFGDYRKTEAVWLGHQSKPQNYSTALSTRVARAIVNIAVPDPQGIKAVDPCCGIGTVLIEALSMGIDIVGFDINPLAIKGARMNLAHFGMPDVVAINDIHALTGLFPSTSEQVNPISDPDHLNSVSKHNHSVSGHFNPASSHFHPTFKHSNSVSRHFDVAIVDLPYNLCSILPSADRLSMLVSARRIASKAVIITTEEIDSVIEQVGFSISDSCFVKKGSFVRHVIVCF